MTDNEIIKALECCITKRTQYCISCSFSQETNCTLKMLEKTLDLINRQKAEIERNREIIEYHEIVISALEKSLESEKNEAIREFAERIKLKADKECERELASYGNYYGRSFIRPTDSDVYIKSYKISEVDLDNLVKEMTEGDNG